MVNTQKINVNNNASNYPIRAVPIDMLPKNEKHLTEDWLHKTIDATPITTNNQTTTPSDSDKHFEVEMQQWKNKK